jgi:YidC/Oxa1 family membrane protein insertase
VIVASVLTPLENVMKSVLDFFHGTVGLSWAWSIVALTVVVRIVLVPLMVRQIHSMQSLQAHAPQMKELQRKYKGDRQKLNEELTKFYKENKINPAASCLPLLAQLPVFFALYLTLKHSKLNGSWLHIVPNVSAHASSSWAGWLLLVIYTGSQVASTYFMGSAMDKTQRRIMMVFPVFLLTVISRFPIGLVIYWLTTNLWTVGQGITTRRLLPTTPAPAAASGRAKPATKPAAARPAAGNGQGAEEPVSAEPPKPKPPQQPRKVRRKKGARR